MAAISKGRVLAASFGKRFGIQISAGRSRVPANPLVPFPARRAVQISSYDKEVDDQVRPAVVPDHVISSGSDDSKYWAPHPKTGVFGPAAEQSGGATGRGGDLGSGSTSVDGSSALDQTAWFRPQEDVDKTPYA